jgi:hypothetical protein
MRAARVTGLMLLALVLVTAGCTTYYRVTDPSSGKVFYTDEITRGSQNIRFTDAKSGSDVTLTTSEVKEISSDEFKKNTAK